LKNEERGGEKEKYRKVDSRKMKNYEIDMFGRDKRREKIKREKKQDKKTEDRRENRDKP
jgi:hypothetical protein